MRGNADHEKAMADHAIDGIDLLAVNLYPFETTLAGGADFDTCIENIDIGGPAMTRAAAKNHSSVTVVVDPGDYSSVLAEIADNGGATRDATRRRLAAKAFALTAAYDTAVSTWLLGQADVSADAPTRSFAGKLRQTLRDGQDFLEEIIKAGIEDKSIRQSSTKRLAQVLFSAFNQMPEWYNPDGSEPPEVIANQILELVSDGIRA